MDISVFEFKLFKYINKKSSLLLINENYILIIVNPNLIGLCCYGTILKMQRHEVGFGYLDIFSSPYNTQHWKKNTMNIHITSLTMQCHVTEYGQLLCIMNLLPELCFEYN